MSLRSRILCSAVMLLVGVEARAAGEPAQPPALSLAECIREALAFNPELRAREARVSAAEAAADAAGAARAPRFDFLGTFAASERAQRIVQPSFNGEPIRYDNEIAEAILEARVPLYAGGRLVARQRSAQLAAAAEGLSLAASSQDLVLNVAGAYFAASEQRAAIRAAEAALAALEAQLAVARTLEEVGRTPPLDRLKVEVRVASISQQVSRLRRDRQVVLQHLARLLGRGPEQPLPEIADSDVEIAGMKGDLSALATDALASRLELRALRSAVLRKHEELAYISGERLPSIDAVARYTARAAVGPTDTPLPTHEQYGAGGVSLRLPLWTGGELAARIRQAQAEIEEAEAKVKAGELTVLEEVRREGAALAEARERWNVATRALTQAREAFAIEQATYEAGRGVINDVLDAQAALLDAEVALARARFDRALSEIALARAAGQDLETALTAAEEVR